MKIGTWIKTSNEEFPYCRVSYIDKSDTVILDYYTVTGKLKIAEQNSINDIQMFFCDGKFTEFHGVLPWEVSDQGKWWDDLKKICKEITESRKK